MITIYKTNSMADASRYVMDVLKRVDKGNLDVTHTVIVPDRASLEAERALLKALGGSFNAQVKTFRRLAADILPKYDYLSKQAGIMVLSGIINDNRDKLTCYTKGVDTAGFVEDMYETLSMLKYCRISPKKLRAADLPKSVAGKAKDIATLYEAYVAYTENRFIDSADKMDLLCETLATTDVASNGYFYLYDFDNFSAQELAIVEQLILKSRGVYVACCVGKTHQDKYLYLDDIYNGVLNICKNNKISPHIVENEHYFNCYTEQIGRNLYRYNRCDSIDETNFVELYEGATRANEVYALACRIQQYVRQGGRFRDVYVVASDVAKYSNAIATIFSQFEIPYFCDRQFALSDHPYARFVVDYLALCRNNGKLTSVLPFVKNYLFCGNFDDALAQNDDVFLFENYCLKYNVSYRYDTFTLGRDEPYFAAADSFRSRFNALYSKMKLPDRATVGQYVAAIRHLIEASDLIRRNQTFATQQYNEGLSFEAKVTEQAADKFEGVLAQAENVLGSRFVSIDEFIKTLSSGLASVKISVIPVYNDCVIFANMAKARKHDIKFLALLGANYGAMPIVKSDTKLLSDRNIKDMASVGVNVEPQIFTENKRERFSLFQLLLEPTDKLYVSYAVVDGADSLTPSPFVGELTSLFTCNGYSLAPTAHEDEDIYTEKQAIAKVILNHRKIQDCQMVNVPSYNALCIKYADELAKYSFGKDGKAVAVQRGGELYLKQAKTSVSQLTDFFHCPYRFYVQYGLNVKPRTVAELNSADLGNILHAVLEQYVRDLNVDEDDITTEQKANKWFDFAMSDDYYKGMRADPKMVGVLDQLREESIRMCKVVKSQLKTSNFVNLATELSFGNGELPPVVVKFEDGEFSLVGKIDRVDVKAGRYIVIDYKSGSSAASYAEKDLYIGHKMQLPVYVKAVQQIYGMRPAGFYYFNMHNNFTDLNKDSVYTYNGRTLNDMDVASDIDTALSIKGKSEKLGLKTNKDGSLSQVGGKLLSDEQFDNQTEYAFMLIAEAGRLMKKGYAAVSPYDGACDYCDYKDICDFGDVFVYNERKVDERVTKETIDNTVKK